ncbi:MAG: ABC transporter permease [Clostridia bacterium]|nr:ABC transporter permease [Clostridia bacterium]
MFGRVLLGEIRKLIRKRGLIVLGVIFGLAILIYALIFNEIVTDESGLTVCAEDFTSLFYSLVVSVLTIYGIVLAAGLYAEEYKRGTIKFVMLRPVSRTTLTTAKLLAALLYVTALALGVTLIVFLYGLARYGSSGSTAVDLVFNGDTPYSTTLSIKTFGAIGLKLLSVYAFMIVAFAIGTLAKNKTLSVVLTIILQAGIFSTPFMLVDSLAGTEIQKVLFSTNADLSGYIGMSASVLDDAGGIFSAIPKGGNIYLAVGLMAGYLTAALLATYLVVNKRDVV